MVPIVFSFYPVIWNFRNTLPSVYGLSGKFKSQSAKGLGAQPTGWQQDADSLNAQFRSAAHEVVKNPAAYRVPNTLEKGPRRNRPRHPLAESPPSLQSSHRFGWPAAHSRFPSIEHIFPAPILQRQLHSSWGLPEACDGLRPECFSRASHSCGYGISEKACEEQPMPGKRQMPWQRCLLLLGRCRARSRSA